jgi:hypothetical protein
VCQGRPLGVEHAFFATNGAVDSGVVESYRTNASVNKAQEDEDDDEDEKWYDVEETQPSIVVEVAEGRSEYIE